MLDRIFAYCMIIFAAYFVLTLTYAALKISLISIGLDASNLYLDVFDYIAWVAFGHLLFAIVIYPFTKRSSTFK